MWDFIISMWFGMGGLKLVGSIKCSIVRALLLTMTITSYKKVLSEALTLKTVQGLLWEHFWLFLSVFPIHLPCGLLMESLLRTHSHVLSVVLGQLLSLHSWTLYVHQQSWYLDHILPVLHILLLQWKYAMYYKVIKHFNMYSSRAHTGKKLTILLQFLSQFLHIEWS